MNESQKMVIVNDPSESNLEEGSIIDRDEFLEINKELKTEVRRVATYRKTKLRLLSRF